MFKYLLFFLSILTIRFGGVADKFVFDIDTQYQALLAKTIIKHFHIIWIGVSASNTGYYLGPGLVYLTAILLWLSKGDPIILAYFAAFIGFLTTLSIFHIADKIYDRKTAIIATVIYGFSSFIIYYDHKYWPIFIPLIGIWMFYSLIKAKQNPRWLVLSIILIAISYHVHLTLFIFWPFILWQFFRSFKKIDWQTWFVSVTSYFAITSTLLVFDFVHNFDNLLMPLRMFKSITSNHSGGINFHFDYLFSLINKIWFDHFLAVIFSILVLIFLLMKIKKSPNDLLAGIVFSFILLFGLYPGPIQEYYIVFLFPFLAIAAALFLRRLPGVMTFIFLSIFIVVNAHQVLTVKTDRGLAVKKELIKKASKEIRGDYYLSFDTDLDYEGWRYLFEAYGKKPAQSKTDAQFGWIYPDEISKSTPKLKLTISGNHYTITSNVGN
jgi:hypothetical protein